MSSAHATTLVPNLEKLGVLISEVDMQEYTHWVTMFLSPRLLDVKLVHYTSGRLGLDSSTVLGLLETISPRCPSLRRLSFFPLEDTDDYEFETKSTIVGQQRLDMLASFRLYLSSFRDLRTLESSVLLLRPGVLSALGELPHLETLSVNGNGREPRIVDLTLPGSSFPSLRHLKLSCFHSANLQYMSEFAPLLHRLTKLSMGLVYEDSMRNYSWEVEEEWDWPLKLMRSVAKNAPLLTDLTVDFETVWACACMSSEWLDALQHLRLKRLSLTNAEFGYSWSDFAAALPHLEEFQATGLSFRSISELAKGLPQLRLLVLDSIDLDSFGDDGEYDDENDDDSNSESAATRTSQSRTAVGFSAADLQLKAAYVELPTRRKIQDIAR